MEAITGRTFGDILEEFSKELLERKWLKGIVGDTSLEPEGTAGGKLRT